MFEIRELNRKDIKYSNRVRIFLLLHARRELTIPEIAKLLDLSIPTVTKSINSLLDKNFLHESGTANSNGGRKPKILSFNPDSRFCFGVDIEPDNVRIVKTNLDFEIQQDLSFAIPDCEPNKVITMTIEKIEEIIAQEGLDKSQILGCGVSVAGVVDQEKYLINLAPNLHWKNISLNRFEAELGIPTFLENEANAAALAEFTLGKYKWSNDLLVISIKQGVGTGLIHNGSLYKGKNNIAGEFGHIMIDPEGMDCTCGRKGCWTMYASLKWIIDEYNQMSKKDYQVKSIEEFIDELKENEPFANLIVSKYINNLIIGINNIVLSVNPATIVLGGEINPLLPYILPPIQKYFKTNQFFNINLGYKILGSRVSTNASALGASTIPFFSFIKEYSLGK